MYGFFTDKRMDGLTVFFLTTTALTSITGFMFPFNGITPGIKLGIISVVVLAVASVARYLVHLAWRKTYVITASVALYLNCFVLVVQSFEKIPALRALAPTQKEPPFAIAQLALLLVFFFATIFAVKRFRIEPTSIARSRAVAV